MAGSRTLTKLELTPAQDGGNHCVQARWERSDGSTGRAVVYMRPKTAERWYIARVTVDLVPAPVLMRDVPLTRIESAVNANSEIREWIKAGLSTETMKLMDETAAERSRLKRPAGSQLDDDFFMSVAEAYRGAVAHGLPPVKTLCEDSDTPAGTVNRWIAAARHPSRGFLPPGEPGSVTF